MIPTLASPGVITPGQFGPIKRVERPLRYSFTLTMSAIGIPSVIVTTKGIPAAAASMIASAANGGGTKIMETLASVFSLASLTVLKTGRLRCIVPPFPGVMPPTMFVPYSIICVA